MVFGISYCSGSRLSFTNPLLLAIVALFYDATTAKSSGSMKACELTHNSEFTGGCNLNSTKLAQTLLGFEIVTTMADANVKAVWPSH